MTDDTDTDKDTGADVDVDAGADTGADTDKDTDTGADKSTDTDKGTDTDTDTDADTDTFDYSSYEMSEEGQKEVDAAFEGIDNDKKKQVLDWYQEKTKELKSQEETEEQIKERQEGEQKEITDAWDKQSREDPLYGKDYEKNSAAEEEVLKKHLSEDEVKTIKSFIFMKHPTVRKLLSQIGNDYNDDKIEFGKAASGDGIKRDMHGNIILSYDKKG